MQYQYVLTGTTAECTSVEGMGAQWVSVAEAESIKWGYLPLQEGSFLWLSAKPALERFAFSSLFAVCQRCMHNSRIRSSTLGEIPAFKWQMHWIKGREVDNSALPLAGFPCFQSISCRSGSFNSQSGLRNGKEEKSSTNKNMRKLWGEVPSTVKGLPVVPDPESISEEGREEETCEEKATHEEAICWPVRRASVCEGIGR